MSSESAAVEIEVEADSGVETKARPWDAPLNSANKLWQKHVISRFPESDENESGEVEIIDIPVESLAEGAWKSIKNGVSPITSVGDYSLQGVKYIFSDSSAVVKNSVDKVKDVISKRASSDEEIISSCDGCDAEKATDAAEKTEKPE